MGMPSTVRMALREHTPVPLWPCLCVRAPADPDDRASRTARPAARSPADAPVAMTEASAGRRFAVSVDFYRHAVLGLRGGLDELALTGLGALLGDVIAGGYAPSPSTCARLDCMTSVRIRVIAEPTGSTVQPPGR